MAKVNVFRCLVIALITFVFVHILQYKFLKNVTKILGFLGHDRKFDG